MEIQHRVPMQASAVRVKLTPPADTQIEATFEAFVLSWFEQMRTGQIDRSRLSPEHNAHLTDRAVKHLSEYLRAYEFGASPIGVNVLRSHSAGEQTFHLTKVLFPRGDAASLLFGFNQDVKVTGVSLMSMAGD
jgi:hypothetical protein